VDQAKCIDLLRQSAALGCPSAEYQLGTYYWAGMMGLERNKIEAFKYWKKAAEGGEIMALHNLGIIEGITGNHVGAMRYLLLSASGGRRSSMEALIMDYFEKGLLHHADLAETLQVMYRARADLKSEDRDKYIEYLKLTGEYTPLLDR